jgi:hypothetical protein
LHSAAERLQERNKRALFLGTEGGAGGFHDRDADSRGRLPSRTRPHLPLFLRRVGMLCVTEPLSLKNTSVGLECHSSCRNFLQPVFVMQTAENGYRDDSAIFGNTVALRLQFGLR